MLLWSGLIFKHNCIYNISIKVWTNKANKMSSKNVCTCYWNIPLIGLTLTHFCACPKPEPGFPTSYFMVFFVFNEWRWKGIVRFVDIDNCWPSLFKLSLYGYSCFYHSSLSSDESGDLPSFTFLQFIFWSILAENAFVYV